MFIHNQDIGQAGRLYFADKTDAFIIAARGGRALFLFPLPCKPGQPKRLVGWPLRAACAILPGIKMGPIARLLANSAGKEE